MNPQPPNKRTFFQTQVGDAGLSSISVAIMLTLASVAIIAPMHQRSVNLNSQSISQVLSKQSRQIPEGHATLMAQYLKQDYLRPYYKGKSIVLNASAPDHLKNAYDKRSKTFLFSSCLPTEKDIAAIVTNAMSIESADEECARQTQVEGRIIAMNKAEGSFTMQFDAVTHLRDVNTKSGKEKKPVLIDGASSSVKGVISQEEIDLDASSEEASSEFYEDTEGSWPEARCPDQFLMTSIDTINVGKGGHNYWRIYCQKRLGPPLPVVTVTSSGGQNFASGTGVNETKKFYSDTEKWVGATCPAGYAFTGIKTTNYGKGGHNDWVMTCVEASVDTTAKVSKTADIYEDTDTAWQRTSCPTGQVAVGIDTINTGKGGHNYWHLRCLPLQKFKYMQ